MRVATIFSVLLAATGVTAFEREARKASPPKPSIHKARRATDSYLNANTSKFAVDGTSFPQVPFDIGESYAGTLPITANGTGNAELFFWFFPSSNPNATDEITIWLNGGPGCSSLVGLLQENGPFLWQPGTYAPVPNPYSYTNLTNMIWIDQPVGVGLSPGKSVVKNEIDVAHQFMGFWENFIKTFSMQGYKVYITGESYAGQYIPYIASEMLNTNDTTYYNVKGIQINDPSINYEETIILGAIVPVMQKYQAVLNLNDSFVSEITALADKCGLTEWYETYYNQFPPTGIIPQAPGSFRNCDVASPIWEAASYVNPCFNVYHLTDFCPFLWNEIGFPGEALGPNNFFNQSDVQAALHVGPTNFEECDNPIGLFPTGDNSLPSALGPLPGVIERTNNVIIGHGLLDMLLIANGSLITIQNMTWNGLQGFQTSPSTTENFFVPYHPGLAEIINGDVAVASQIAGAGYMGVTHTERGLTFVTVSLSGHEIPQYVPGAAYRQLEFLLGRIDSLEQLGDFTTSPGNFTGTTPVRDSKQKFAFSKKPGFFAGSSADWS